MWLATPEGIAASVLAEDDGQSDFAAMDATEEHGNYTSLRGTRGNGSRTSRRQKELKQWDIATSLRHAKVSWSNEGGPTCGSVLHDCCQAMYGTFRWRTAKRRRRSGSWTVGSKVQLIGWLTCERNSTSDTIWSSQLGSTFGQEIQRTMRGRCTKPRT